MLPAEPRADPKEAPRARAPRSSDAEIIRLVASNEEARLRASGRASAAAGGAGAGAEPAAAAAAAWQRFQKAEAASGANMPRTSSLVGTSPLGAPPLPPTEPSSSPQQPGGRRGSARSRDSVRGSVRSRSRSASPAKTDRRASALPGAGGGRRSAVAPSELAAAAADAGGSDSESGGDEGAAPFYRRRSFWARAPPTAAASAALFVAGGLALHYEATLSLAGSRLQLWRLLFFLGGLPLCWWLGDGAARACVWAVERSMFTVRNALYYCYAARRPARALVRAALVLGSWALAMGVGGGARDAALDDAYAAGLRLLGCVCVYATANLLKTLLAKRMATKFQARQQERMRRALYREHLLHQLLQPRSELGGGGAAGGAGAAGGWVGRAASAPVAAARGLFGRLGRAPRAGDAEGGGDAAPTPRFWRRHAPPRRASGGEPAGLPPPPPVAISIFATAGGGDGAAPASGGPGTAAAKPGGAHPPPPPPGGASPRGSTATAAGRGSTARPTRRSVELGLLAPGGGGGADGGGGCRDRGAARDLVADRMARLERYIRRNALEVSYRDALNRTVQTEEVATEADAKKLAFFLFHNVKADWERESVTPDDLRDFLGDADAAAAFAWLSAQVDDGDGVLSLQDCAAAAVEMLRERRALAKSLNDTRSIVKTLERLLGAVLHFLCVFAYLAIWRFDVNKAYLALSSLVLSFAFVFGSSMRAAYENVIFLFVVHPFDVGDSVLLANSAGPFLDVEEITLAFTVFQARDGRRTYVPNAALAASTFVNVSTSGPLGESLAITVDLGTPESALEALRAAAADFAAAHLGGEVSAVGLNFANPRPPMKMDLVVYIKYTHNGLDGGRVSRARTKVVAFVAAKLAELDVKCDWPTAGPALSFAPAGK